MTTSSLNARQPEYRQLASTQSHREVPAATREKEASPQHHACEIQRMKEFAGRQRFQAPVADDFTRGLLPPGQGKLDESRSPLPMRRTLASVILGLRSLCT